MEIERKFLVTHLPENLSDYAYHNIEQAYLCTDPVVRIRRQDEEYYLTYKGRGMMVREEYNLPLTKAAYLHLKEKADGNIVSKKRVLIPLEGNLKAELDLFYSPLPDLVIAEVEFPDEESANSFQPTSWFGQDVTFDSHYHNSYLSTVTVKEP